MKPRKVGRVGFLVCGAIVAEIGAFGQTPQQKLDVSAAVGPAACKPQTPDDVVVCGQRGPSRYRIDLDVLEVTRREEEAARRVPKASRAAEGDPCTVGPNGCPGAGAIPVSKIALTAATVAVKALKGEDWREPLRIKADEYQLYLKSKSERESEAPEAIRQQDREHR